MKKIILMILIISIVIVTGIVGVLIYNQNVTNNEENSKTQNNVNETSNKDDKEEENIQDWGVTDSFYASKDGDSVAFYINFPSLTGIPEATGTVAYQKDDTRVIVDEYIEGKSPEVDSVSEVFPAYFEQTIKIFEVNYGSRYSDGNFVIESQESVTINDYEMCKYTGTHTFKYKGKEFDYCFVAYSTQLKTNGAYIYWLVQDESENQSLSKTIDEYATKMGYTLVEEE